MRRDRLEAGNVRRGKGVTPIYTAHRRDAASARGQKSTDINNKARPPFDSRPRRAVSSIRLRPV